MKVQSNWLGNGGKDKTRALFPCLSNGRVQQEATPWRPSSVPSLSEELHDFMCCVDSYSCPQFWGLMLWGNTQNVLSVLLLYHFSAPWGIFLFLSGFTCPLINPGCFPALGPLSFKDAQSLMHTVPQTGILPLTAGTYTPTPSGASTWPPGSCPPARGSVML